ncbi:MAG: hypothetical protein RLZZ540_2178 [Bacteroidota bacterium]|jgi:hypothetical protein
MKKIYKKQLIFLFFVSFIGLSSCNDLIDISSPGITQDAIPMNQKDAVGLITGCYSTFMDYDQTQGVDNWVEGYFCQWLVSEECGDDIYKGGDSHGDFQAMEDLGYFKTGYNNVIDWKWRKMWIGIARCNKAIISIPNVPGINVDLSARLVGEAQFLRAYFYMELLRNFGDLPIITTPITAFDVNQPRVAVKDVYEKLVEPDLVAAAAILPQKTAYAAADAGRATRGAALSLLAKAYLYQKKWSNAFTTGKMVIDEGQYNLETNFRDVFEVDNVNGKESIFEIAYSGNQTYPFGWVGANAIGSRDDINWGWLQPSTDLDREFESGDPRHQMTIIHDGDTFVDGWGGQPYPITALRNNQAPYTASYKYFIPKSKRVSNNWLRQNYNLELIRYADLLLMYGEAALQSGNQVKADWAVEQVRSRARNQSANPSMTLPIKTGVTMNDIIHERRVELATEGHRFYDLKRWGIAQQVLNALPAKIATYPEALYIGAKGALYQSPRNDYFQIPPTDVSRAGWTQNPGY